jgi:CheY-like chemotaxis protein
VAGLPKILLVEDTPEIAEIYTRVLSKGGLTVKSVTTVDDLLAMVVDYDPDIIFLDIMLPGGRTGLDALILLRSDPQYGATKTRIVLLTNLGQSSDIQKLWEEYADGYVVKAEIDPKELFDVIASFGFEVPAQS